MVKRASLQKYKDVDWRCSDMFVDFRIPFQPMLHSICVYVHELDVGSTLDLHGSDSAVALETRESAK